MDESLTPPGQGTTKAIAGKLPADAGTHLPTPEGWKAELALVGKKVTQISSNLGWQSGGLNWGPCVQKAEILLTAPTTPAQLYVHCRKNKYCLR